MKSSREYPERPMVGIGGVVIYEERALLIKRGSEPLLGQWSIPGGSLELGETLVEGVDRPRYHYVIVDYLCERIRGEARAGGDAVEVAWAREEELEGFEMT